MVTDIAIVASAGIGICRGWEGLETSKVYVPMLMDSYGLLSRKALSDSSLGVDYCGLLQIESSGFSLEHGKDCHILEDTKEMCEYWG